MAVRGASPRRCHFNRDLKHEQQLAGRCEEGTESSLQGEGSACVTADGQNHTPREASRHVVCTREQLRTLSPLQSHLRDKEAMLHVSTSSPSTHFSNHSV